MGAYRESLDAKKQDFIARLSHIRGMLMSGGGFGEGGDEGQNGFETAKKETT